jgi:TRAP-type uncharacterized transport system substrate-binding protein
MIIYLFFILILYYFYKILNKKNIKENYYNYFNPFVIEKKNTNYKYKKLDNVNLLISKNLYDKTNKYLIFLFYYLKLNISETFYDYDIILNYENNEKEIINKINNTNSIGYISYPALYKYYNFNIANNIRFIFNGNNHFLIPLTKNLNIDSLKDIENNMPIVIDNELSSTYIILNYIFKYLNKKENIHFHYVYKYNIQNILNYTNNNNDSFGFISISFPSKFFTKFIEKNKLRIIDYGDLNLNTLLNTFFYLQFKDFNLSNVSFNYLPYKLRNNKYTIFKPFIKLINYNYLFITNKNVNKDIIYNLCVNYYNNINNINNLYQFKDYKLTIINSFNLSINNLFIHNGSEKFMNDIGIISYEDNKNCANFTTKISCTKKNLEKYNFITNYN